MIFGERIRLRAIEREDLQLILHHGFNDLNLNRIFYGLMRPIRVL